MLEDELDAAQDGLAAAYTELFREERFRKLVGWLATVYGVTQRKVTSIDQRSFRVAKEELLTFLARTSGWSAKLSRDTRNGSWRRGATNSNGGQQGWTTEDATLGVGGRGGGLRGHGEAPSAELPAADQPPPLPHPLGSPAGPRSKECCPGCSSRAQKVWSIRTPNYSGVVCPSCVRKRSRGEA